MHKRNSPTHDEALNRLSLIANALRYISAQAESTELAALLQLLGQDLEESLMALDPPSNQ